MKIRAITARSFEVHLDMLLLVLQSLEAAGLQRHPAWELHRGVRSVSITPTLVARRLRYSVEALGDWTADRALLAHPEPLELAGAQACADRLVAAGFQARQLWWFSGSRVSVRLWAAALGKTDSYYLVLKGAGRSRIIDLLNALGVDWQGNDPAAIDAAAPAGCTLDELAALVQRLAPLSAATARRRAQAVLAWLHDLQLAAPAGGCWRRVADQQLEAADPAVAAWLRECGVGAA